MIDIKLVRNNYQEIADRLATRGFDPANLKKWQELDQKRRQLLTKTEDLKKIRNTVSQEISTLKRNKEDATDKIKEMQDMGSQISSLDQELKSVTAEFDHLGYTIPNLPHPDAPIGPNEDSNVEVKKWGDLPHFDFEPQAHWDLGENLDILDFERGAKVTGARFLFYKGLGAKLERALYNFMLDEHSKEGYTEVIPPYMVNDQSMYGTGQFPKFKEDVFQLKDSSYTLISTAEIPLTNYYRDEILAEKDLPIYLTAMSPSFRSEAGSAGRDTRGLIRLHQFHKVEMVKITHPDNSYEELDKMVVNAENILQKLELPYRVVTLSTGDMGFAAAKTYDLEVWIPAQNTYREISSCSNTEDFQARNAKIRYRADDGKTHYVHTLNGSGLAVGRTVAAILENYQNADGSVTIPTVLRSYLNGVEKITRA